MRRLLFLWIIAAYGDAEASSAFANAAEFSRINVFYAGYQPNGDETTWLSLASR